MKQKHSTFDSFKSMPENEKDVHNQPVISPLAQQKNMFILLCFILSVNAVQSLHAQENQNMILDDEQRLLLDSISQNPSGKIYFFDGKEISEPDFYVKIFTRQLRGMSASIYSGKNAIIRFGERYRYGIMFGEAENKNDIQEDPKTEQKNETDK